MVMECNDSPLLNNFDGISLLINQNFRLKETLLHKVVYVDNGCKDLKLGRLTRNPCTQVNIFDLFLYNAEVDIKSLIEKQP